MNKISRRYRLNNRSFLIVLLISLFVSSFAVPQHQKFDSLAQLVEKIGFYQGEQAYALLEEMYRIAENDPDSIKLITKCLCTEAKLSFDQKKLSQQLVLRIENQLQLLDENTFAYEQAELRHALGLCQCSLGEYSQAFINELQALEKFKELNDSAYISKTAQQLGVICFDLNLPKISSDYFSEALAYVSKDDEEYYRIQHNKYLLYSFEKKTRLLIDSLKHLITVAGEVFNNDTLLITFYPNLAMAYLINNDLDSAYHYYIKSQQLIEHVDNKNLQASLYSSLGRYMYRKQDYEKSLAYYTRGREIFEEEGNFMRLNHAYSGLSLAFEGLGKYDSAFFYLKKHKEASQKYVSVLGAVEVYQNYITTYLELTQDKLLLAQQEVILKNRQFLVIVITSIAIILVILLLLLLMRQQKRRKESENRELEAQVKIQDLEQKQQEENLKAKMREITSYSLLVSNKNSVLGQIKELNDQICSHKENTEIISKKIQDVIQNNFSSDEEWKNFKIHFEQVHPDFFNRLKNICPELTDENLRLCSYFKIRMTTKEIAQLLHIAPRSVLNQRHRLKKKLGLKEEDDLDRFVCDI